MYTPPQLPRLHRWIVFALVIFLLFMFSSTVTTGHHLPQIASAISNSTLALLRLAALQPLFAQSSEPILDPLPPLYHDGAAIQFKTIATLPASTNEPFSPSGNPRTRLNFLDYAPDGSGRLFINDLRGQLYVVHPDTGAVTLYFDLTTFFPNWKEEPGLNSGFSTFAFHPDFANNGHFYTIHTEEPNGTPDYTHRNSKPTVVHGVIVEWTTVDPTGDTFTGTHREILRIAHSWTTHGIQLAQFNPNATPSDADYGKLYISIGDGERSAAMSDGPQDRTTLNGTIIRIDPLGNNSPNGKYGIPTDNPFYTVGGPGREDIRQEIYAYGFRNPNRFGWDTGGSGMMVTTDIGENNVEELNLIKPGANYGWNVREGTFRFERDGDRDVVYPLPANDAELGYTYPVAQYDHDDGSAIEGGTLYRGALMPAMDGMYIFSDIVAGFFAYVDATTLQQGEQSPIYKLMLLDEARAPVDFRTLVDPTGTRADIRFGVDAEGELYLFSKQDGVLRKLVAAQAAPGRSLITRIIRLSTDSAYEHDVVAAAVGESVYTDEALTIATIPSSLADADLLVTRNQDRTVATNEHLTFLLGRDAALYVALAEQATIPSWLADWTPTSLAIGVNDGNAVLTYHLYRKDFSGGPVTLGGAAQEQNGGYNYFILATTTGLEGTATPTPQPTHETATGTPTTTPTTTTVNPTATMVGTPTATPTATAVVTGQSTVSGKVWYDYRPGIEPRGGSEDYPLAGAAVAVTWAGADGELESSDDVAVITVNTDEQGRFTVDKVPAGLFHLQASYELVTGTMTITVASGETINHLALIVTGIDLDDDHIVDTIEGDGDLDQDGIPNYADTDADGDGLTDRFEGTADRNGNGIPDFLDVEATTLNWFLPILRAIP